MAEVDFSDEESAKAWFEGQSVAISCAISSRAALRVSANICPRGENAASDLALPVLRAILTSAGRGFTSPADVSPINWEQIARSAFSAADSAHSATAHSATAHSAARSAARSARSAADSAFSAADSADSARSAAFSAAFSAADSAAFSAADSAHSATTWDSQRSPAALSSQRVWAGAEVPDAIAENHQRFLTFLRSDPAWAFWLRFYEGMWEGTFDEWDLAFEVIQIEEADWEKGFEHIGKVIAGIEARLRRDLDPKPPSKAQSIAFASRANDNSQAMALTVASLMEQLSVYREAVRGDNQSDPAERQELLDFIDRLNGSLCELLALLPKQGEVLNQAGGAKLVLWWREFKSLIPKEARKYTNPANVTAATIPTAIILSGTALGTLVGGPAGGGVGALVGGLITNQIKPGKAAEDLMKPEIVSSPE